MNDKIIESYVVHYNPVIKQGVWRLKYYPESVVNGLIFNKRGDILLIRTDKWNDMLSLPGGHVEIGENLRNTVKREVSAQLGLDVEVKDMLNVQEFIMPPDYYTRKHLILFNFACYSDKDDVALQYRHIKGHIWIRPEDALCMNLEPYAMETLKTYIKTTEKTSSPGFSVATTESNIKVRF